VDIERQSCHIRRMIRTVSPVQSAELERLRAELQESFGRQTAALKIEGPLQGEALAQLLKEHEKAVAIAHRINEILG
jgi:hypothetical protein